MRILDILTIFLAGSSLLSFDLAIIASSISWPIAIIEFLHTKTIAELKRYSLWEVLLILATMAAMVLMLYLYFITPFDPINPGSGIGPTVNPVPRTGLATDLTADQQRLETLRATVEELEKQNTYSRPIVCAGAFVVTFVLFAVLETSVGVAVAS